MSFTLEDIFNHKNLVWDEAGKEVMKQQTPKQIIQFLQGFSKKWLKDLQREEVNSLLIRLISILPITTPSKALKCFLDVMKEDGLDVSETNFHELFFKNNRALFEKTWPTFSDKDLTESEYRLNLLEQAMICQMPNIIHDLMKEDLSLDHRTLTNRTLLDIVLEYGSLQEIQTVMVIFCAKNRQEELQKKGFQIFNHFMKRKPSTEDLEKLLNFWREKGLNTQLVVNKGQYELLSTCIHLQSVWLLLDQLDPKKPQEKKEALEKQGRVILHQLLQDTPENLECFLKKLKELDIKLGPLFVHKPDSYHLTPLDRACSNKKTKHVEVLLNYMEDEEFWEIVCVPSCQDQDENRNKDQDRSRNIQQCERFLNKECEELIRKKIRQLSKNKKRLLSERIELTHPVLTGKIPCHNRSETL